MNGRLEMIDAVLRLTINRAVSKCYQNMKNPQTWVLFFLGNLYKENRLDIASPSRWIFSLSKGGG